jgi:[ribosomal protein S18]-alanine N-acetyltransferase
VNIRLADRSDLPQLLALDQSSPGAAHWTGQQYEHALRSHDAPERLVLIAGAPGQVIAFLAARHVALEWELENIVVNPASRRAGHGRQLLAGLIERARETKSEAIFLEVRASNLPAQTLYESAGFVRTGIRKSYYTNPAEDAVLYRLELGLAFR